MTIRPYKGKIFHDALGRLGVSKSVKDAGGKDAWPDGATFDFKLEPVDGAPMPTGKDGKQLSSQTITASKGNPNPKFDEITYLYDSSRAGQTETFTYKVSEVVPADSTKVAGVTYDASHYEAVVSVSYVATSNGGTATVTGVKLTRIASDGTRGTAMDGNMCAFTNTYETYSTTGSFTPEVKKHVDGGEVKAFQFELFDEKGYDRGKWDGTALQTKTTTKSDKSDAKVTFDTIHYTLGVKDLDTKARGGKATYTYYIREMPGTDNGYTYDGGYYKVVVTATDNSNGTLNTSATYTYVDANGNESPASTDNPTFNNKYATSLPNAGQAGIALAYVAGGAALAYGLWRLLKSRRDARKGGDGR
ncbi:MAG: Spy0128 family protein [Atopobiaceae bacterium]